MVEVRIDQMLADRGRTAYWLAKETGIAQSAMWKLRHRELLAFRFDYLEKICRALNCQPGDLLVVSGQKTDKVKASRTRRGRR